MPAGWGLAITGVSWGRGGDSFTLQQLYKKQTGFLEVTMQVVAAGVPVEEEICKGWGERVPGCV